MPSWVVYWECNWRQWTLYVYLRYSAERGGGARARGGGLQVIPRVGESSEIFLRALFSRDLSSWPRKVPEVPQRVAHRAPESRYIVSLHVEPLWSPVTCIRILKHGSKHDVSTSNLHPAFPGLSR